MPVSIVRNLGNKKQATLPNGRIVERQESLQLTDGSYPCLPTDTHFVYVTTHFGSRMMCTCGGEAALVGYHAYKKYASYIANEVIACLDFLNLGHHRDGSH
jgi:hypothetical protein